MGVRKACKSWTKWDEDEHAMQIHGQINVHKQNNKLINTNWSLVMLGHNHK